MTEKIKCDICNKKFKNQEALDMHMDSKHPASETKPGKVTYKSLRRWGIFIIIVGLLVWGVYAMIQSQGQHDEFAQCLTEEGVKMYGAYWCPACQEQKRIFGSSWDYVEYVECSLPNRGGQNELCNSEGIQSYPTWEFADGTKVSGILSISQLNEKTGCLDKVSSE